MRARTSRALTRGALGIGLLPVLLSATVLPAAAAPAPEAPPSHANEDQSHGQAKKNGLRTVAPDDLVIGTAAAGGGHHVDAGYPDPFTYDKQYRRLLAAEFSSVSPENQMKWDFIHPEPGVYNWGPADAIVDFAEANGQVVRGHTLLWHSQLPAWVHEIEDPEELRAVLKEHIQTVVGRYAGRIQQWDVANEIFADEWDDGGVRLRDGETGATANPFIEKLGPGIIADAFRWAHEADPEAELFLNDYAVEDWNTKSTAYYDLAEQLLADGVPLDGFAFQAHLDLQYPFPSTLQANMQRFDDLGLETAITELDVRFTLPEGGVPTQEQLEEQADTYQGVLEACLAVEECNSFTIWGFTDKYSWVPSFSPGQGAATVMSEDYERKPAYWALHETLAAAQD
ncbi:endo-1,4-beta-xylanase (glycosyl hydrolase family 10) [Geodermatophilus saharensis]|uniref:Beta-xylanase n=1 Tax=Geodermatophilus saharensis TaxID=1137994 RepID=A0A239BLC3_9ACTN|nr:endo-1,4-beta-xylanase [Geodermatophilus saharensis]SNS08945.1 endo-1,4-beta-xylanase (glycosyl hydrolase family 10) [Geodermatophilus saharensis]